LSTFTPGRGAPPACRFQPDEAWWQEHFMFSFAVLKAIISMFCGQGKWFGLFFCRKC